MCPQYEPVFFDVETTGGRDDDDIIQIGAINKYNEVFCRYILPDKPIPPFVSEMTGFQKIGNKLYHEGDPVPTTPLGEALYDFTEYLRDQRKPVILIGHDCLNQPDCRFIFRDSELFDLTYRLRRYVDGFTDSLRLMRECLPGRSRYNLEALARDFLGETPVSHEAVEDSRTLLRIFRRKDLFSDIYPYSRSFDDVFDDYEKRLYKRMNRSSGHSSGAGYSGSS